MKYQNISVTGFIRLKKKVLIVQRSTHEEFFPNVWELPGGKLEWGEKPFDGAAREVKEETGLTVQSKQVFWVSDYIPNDERHTVEVGIICDVVGASNVAISADHQAHTWASEEDIKSLTDITDYMRNEILTGFEFLRQWNK